MFNLPRNPLFHRTPGVEGSGPGSIQPNVEQTPKHTETPVRTDRGREIKGADATKYLDEQDRPVIGTGRAPLTDTEASSVPAHQTSGLNKNKLDSDRLLQERSDLLEQAEKLLGTINEKKVVGISLEQLEIAQANGAEQVLETLQSMKFPEGLKVQITLKSQPNKPLSLIPPGDELIGQKKLGRLMDKTVETLKNHHKKNLNKEASISKAEKIRQSLVTNDNKIAGRDTRGQGEGAQAFDQLKSRRCEITVHHRSPVEQSYVEAKHHVTGPLAKSSASEHPQAESGQAERTEIRKLAPSPQKLTTPQTDTENTETLLVAEQSPPKTTEALSPESPPVPEKTKPDSTPLTEQGTARKAFSHDENGRIDTEEKGLTKTTYSNSQEQAVPITSYPAGDIPEQTGTPVYPVPLPLVNTSQTIVTPQPEEKGVVSPQSGAQATDSADTTTTETPPFIQEAEQKSIPEPENEGTITAENDHSAVDPFSTAQEQADPIPHQSVDESLQQPVSATSYSPLSDGDIATEAKLSVTDPAPAPKEQVDAIPQALSIDESPLQTIPVDTHSPLPEAIPAHALSQEEIQKSGGQTASSKTAPGIPDAPSPRFSDLLELVDKVKSKEEQSNQYSPVDELQPAGIEASIRAQEAEQVSRPQTEDIAAGAKHSVKAEPSDIQPEKALPTPPTSQTESTATVTPQTESAAQSQDSLKQEEVQDPRSAMLEAIRSQEIRLKPTNKAHPAQSKGKQTSGNKAPDSKTAGAPEQNSGISTTSAGPLEPTEESALNGPVSPSGEHQPGAITVPATPTPVPEELEVTQTEVEQISSTQVSSKEADRITVPIDEIDSVTSPEEVAQLYTPEPFTGEYQPAQTTFSVSPFPESEDPQATAFTQPEPISPTQANSRATDDIAVREDKAEETSSSNKPRSDSKFKAELIQAAAKMMGRAPDSIDTDETTDTSETSSLSPEELINKMDASLPAEEIVQAYSSAPAPSEHQTTKATGAVPDTSPETETGEQASTLQTDSSSISAQGLPEEFDDVADDPEHSILATPTSTQPSQDSDDTGPLKPPSPPVPPPISEALLRSAKGKTAPEQTSTTQPDSPETVSNAGPYDEIDSESSSQHPLSGQAFKNDLAAVAERMSKKHQAAKTDIDTQLALEKKEREAKEEAERKAKEEAGVSDQDTTNRKSFLKTMTSALASIFKANHGNEDNDDDDTDEEDNSDPDKWK